MAQFSKAEEDVIQAFLAGGQREFILLRFQFDQIKRFGFNCIYPNEHLHQHFYYLWKRIFDSFPERRLGVPTFGEDCALGTGRPRIMNDVAVELSDGRFLCFQLEIRGGLLSALRILGQTDGPDMPLTPVKCWGTSWFKAKQVHYLERSLASDGKGFTKISKARNPQGYEHILPLNKMSDATTFQAWLTALDETAILIPAEWIDYEFKLPLTIRRSTPAQASELNTLKESNHFALPLELEEFWSLCDGCMFLGERIHGVHDLLNFKDKYGRHWDKLCYRPGFRPIPLRMGEDQRVLVAEVYPQGETPPSLTHIRLLPPDPEYPNNEWSSLRSFFESEIAVVRERLKQKV